MGEIELYRKRWHKMVNEYMKKQIPVFITYIVDLIISNFYFSK